MVIKEKLKIVLVISIIFNLFLGGYLLFGSSLKELPPQKEKKNLSDVGFFTEYFKVDDEILFVGDSWIAKGEWRDLLKNPKITTDGEGGITTYQFFMEFNDKIKGKPSKVFLLLGINDLVKGAPKDFIMENFHRILYELKAKSPLTDIYIISLFPVLPEIISSEKPLNVTNEMIDSLNITLKEFTETFGINYIDANTLLKDSTGKIDAKYTIDGLHLSKEGYNKIIPALKDII